MSESVSACQGSDDYDSKDIVVSILDTTASREIVSDNDWALPSHNSMIPGSSHTDKGPSKLLVMNEILSYLEADGCKDAGTQLDWPSVDSAPVRNQEISQGFGPLSVYHGRLKNGQPVKLSYVMHALVEDDVDKLKGAARELTTWSKCKHPNILGLVGVAVNHQRIATVSPWTDYLDLHEFLLAHPKADRYVLSTRMAYGVAYLHNKHIAHGYIMGSNIAVMRDHTPKITGFCEATLSNLGFPDQVPRSNRIKPHQPRYSPARWLAPEILLDEKDKNVEGDVYSLAMTILETITGAVPYEDMWNGAAVLKIANGHHPRRPIAHMPYENEKADMLWTLLGECWASDPQDRPTSVEVLARMTDMVSGSWMHASCHCAPNSPTRRAITAHIVSDTIIHRQMSVEETLSHLYEHGCKDATRFIDHTKYSSYPVSYGGFGEVYRGKLKDGSQIALKCLRLALDSSEASQKQIRNAAHELYIWSKCHHPNVLELIGVTQYRNQIAMVSPWMEHTTLGRYLSRYPQVDRCTLSTQIADGVAYLHGENIVHGDIKGTNILISKDHTAVITDFGTATLKEYTLKFTASATTSKPGMSLRWTAPEILEEATGISFEGDVYALGMTILETITGEVPYSETVNESALVLKIARQEHPTRPETKIPSNDEKADTLWSLLTRCWSYNPQDRPTVTEVQKTLRAIASGTAPESTGEPVRGHVIDF
ncbi:tyrosine kinase catalytic domain protein [Rhizoctonia solani AG-3 Rhs1AP]|uniref:Tyrosine kinase catalytic domain protein n=1 Tax=Rhizoctonia solani AG-3 Rhs1AP TaxID=1086054 RepID=X8JPX4_9AGAM|nr:tyrosine kinase catalytic domain protein [Rhizoctonia solani AG-3 Rhs1AP]